MQDWSELPENEKWNELEVRRPSAIAPLMMIVVALVIGVPTGLMLFALGVSGYSDRNPLMICLEYLYFGALAFGVGSFIFLVVRIVQILRPIK